MTNTGVYKEYQGRGALSILLKLLNEKGFQKVTSMHHPSNNAVIVPKLKAGFVISGFEIDERHGILVKLTFLYSKDRLKAFQFRTGSLKPDE